MDRDKLDAQLFNAGHDMLDEEITPVEGQSQEGIVVATVPYWRNEFRHSTVHAEVRRSLHQIEDDEQRLSTHAEFINHWNSHDVQKCLGDGIGQSSTQNHKKMLKKIMEILEKYPGLASDIQSQASCNLGAVQRSVITDLKIDITKIRGGNVFVSRHQAEGREALQKSLVEMDRQQADLQANKSRLEHIERELADAQAELSAARGQALIHKVQSLDQRKKISQLETRLGDFESENTVLQQFVDDKTRQLSSLEDTKRQQEQRLQTLERNQVENAREITRLTEAQRLAALSIDKQRQTERQLKNTEIENEDLEIRHQTDVEKIESLDKGLSQTMDALKIEQHKYRELHAEVNVLKHEKMQLELDYQNEHAENGRLQRLISSLRSNVSESQSHNSTLSEKVRLLEQEVSDDRRRINEARDESTEQKSQNFDLKVKSLDQKFTIDTLIDESNRLQKSLADAENELVLSKDINLSLVQLKKEADRQFQTQIESLCKLVCHDNPDNEVVSSEDLLHRWVDTQSIETNLVLRDTPKYLFTAIYGLSGMQNEVKTSVGSAFRLLVSNIEGRDSSTLALIDRCADLLNEAGPPIRRLLLGAICADLRFMAETVVGPETKGSPFCILLLIRSLELISLWLTEEDWKFLQFSILLRKLKPLMPMQQPLVRAMYCMIDLRVRDKQETALPAMLRHMSRPGQDWLTFGQTDIVRGTNALVVITEKDEIFYVPQEQVKILFGRIKAVISYRIAFENCAKLGSWSTCWKALDTNEAYTDFARVVEPLSITPQWEGI